MTILTTRNPATRKQSRFTQKIFFLRPYILTTILVSSSAAGAGAWKQVQVGYGGTPVKVVINDGKIYVGQLDNRFDSHPRTLISSDPASGWRQVRNKDSLNVCDIAIDNKNHLIYLGKSASYYRSPTALYKTDNDFSIITPLYHGDKNQRKFEDECPAMEVISGRLVVSASGRIYYSDNQGQTFRQAQLPNGMNDDNDTEFTDIKANDNNILIATTGMTPFSGSYGKPKGIFFSTDQGETWRKSDAPDKNNYQNSATVVVGDTFYSFARTADGNAVLKSKDGENWQVSKLNLKITPFPFLYFSIPFTVDENQRMYLSSEKGIWMTKNGTDWRLILKQEKAYPILSVFNGNLLDVEWGGSVKMYSPETSQWTRLDGIPSSVRAPMLSTPDAAYVQAFSGLYKLTKNGADWYKIPGNYGNYGVGYQLSYSQSNNSLYAGFQYCGVTKSSDGGKTFELILPDLPDKCLNESINPGGFFGIRSIGHIGNNTLLGINDLKNGILISDDDKSADYVYGTRQWPHQFINTDGEAVYAAIGYEGVSRSLDSGLTWQDFSQEIPPQEDIRHLAFDKSSNVLFSAGTGIYQRNLTSDHWRNISSGLPFSLEDPSPAISDVLVHAGQIYVTIPKFGVYTKPISDPQSHWTALNDGLVSKNTMKIMEFSNNLYLNLMCDFITH